MGDPCELAILDMMMPGMDGLELAGASRPIQTLIPFPSYCDHLRRRGLRLRSDAHAIGISAYLTKPVRQSQLYDCIASVALGAQSGETPQLMSESREA